MIDSGQNLRARPYERSEKRHNSTHRLSIFSTDSANNRAFKGTQGTLQEVSGKSHFDQRHKQNICSTTNLYTEDAIMTTEQIASQEEIKTDSVDKYVVEIDRVRPPVKQGDIIDLTEIRYEDESNFDENMTIMNEDENQNVQTKDNLPREMKTITTAVEREFVSGPSIKNNQITLDLKRLFSQLLMTKLNMKTSFKLQNMIEKSSIIERRSKLSSNSNHNLQGFNTMMIPNAISCIPNIPRTNPVNTLCSYIKELKSSAENPEETVKKYLKIFDKEQSFTIDQKELLRLLPGINPKREQALLKTCGISQVKPMEKENKAAYKIIPHQYIIATVINSKGCVDFEKRVEFALKLFDHNNDKKIEKQELKEMLIAYAKEDQIKIDERAVEEICNVILRELPNGRGDSASIQDLSAFLDQYNKFDVKVKLFERRMSKLDYIKSQEMRRESLDSATLFVNPSLTTINSPLPVETQNSLVNLEEPNKVCNTKASSKSIAEKIKEKLFKVKSKLQTNGIKYLWMMAWLAVCTYLFIIRVKATEKKTGLLSGGFARGFAILINLNTCLLLLLASKSFNTILRFIGLSKLIPLNLSIFFHKVLGALVFLFSFAHSLVHLVFFLPSLSNIKDLKLLNSILHTPVNKVHTYSWWIIQSLPGITGFIALALMAILIIGTIKKIRDKYFEAFWYTHKLWIPILAVVCLHGQAKYLASPQFMYWISFPPIVILLEKFYTVIILLKSPLKILKLEYLETGLIELRITKPKNFKFVCGQFGLINVPKLSRLQWHPFSFSSANEDPYLSFHISPAGDWTTKLKKLAQDIKSEKLSILPSVYLQGPYGAPSQDYHRYKHLIIVTTGVGATPFASILRGITQKMSDPEANLKFKSIDFYWINRRPCGHAWLNKLFKEIQSDERCKNIVKINVFFTSIYAKYDIRSLLMWKGLSVMSSRGESVKGIENLDVINWRRPNWDQIFQKKSEELRKGRVGVFFCGNNQVGNIIANKCEKYSGQVVFEFHKEVF